ncbi:MAG: histidine kinase [Prevotella sp.]|nr:histidine kinase [Prevotella sp.]
MKRILTLGMSKIHIKDVWLFVAQVLLLSLVMLSPGLISYITSNDAAVVWGSLRIAAYWLAPAVLVYLLNFYVCVPLLWFRRRFWMFAIVNVMLITACNFHLLFTNINSMPDDYRAGYSSFQMIAVLVNLMAIGIALSIRYVMRQNEKKQKVVEAELAWLKNQINPHFLFNTLNNISSLAQIDGDETQEAIMQLSDLLRYAMYETNKPKVALEGEVEFMRNYIELMKLRCNEQTKVSSQFSILNSQLEVAPLLFISLIENAFKHGMDSNAPATIDISLTEKDGTLVFVCDNTNNPKSTKDRSGSGIGLENTRRRLNLIYQGRYQWEQTITPENIYHVKITLQP